MAKRHSTQPIPPFPSDIDRHDFGHWLSGFTDGEGCFQISRDSSRSRVPYIRFTISLREDDFNILSLIQSYWQCGLTYKSNFSTTKNPLCSLFVRKWDDLLIVVNHFVKYPLLAKKKEDFKIWHQAVLFGYDVFKRPRKGLGLGKGSSIKWTNEELQKFLSFQSLLKEQRRYIPSS